MKPFRSQNGELSFPTGQSSISLYFFSHNPKCRFILFQYVTVHICAKFIDLQSTIDEKLCSLIWTCFWARRRNNIPQGNCNFFRPNYSCMFINHCEQQIVGRKTWNLEFFFGTTWGQLGKIWEKPDFSSDLARILAFSSQRHTMWSKIRATCCTKRETSVC